MTTTLISLDTVTSETLKIMFKDFLQTSFGEFTDSMSTLFAYTVMTEGDNEFSDEPLKIEAFKTLDALLVTRLAAKVDTASWEIEEGRLIMPQESFEVATWRDHFINTIHFFVLDKYDMMLTEVMGIESTDEIKLKKFRDMVGEDFLTDCAMDLQAIIFGADPLMMYTKGKAKAKEMVEESKNKLDQIEMDFFELSESLVRINRLWGKISEMYQATFKEAIPKGRISDELYYKQFQLILLNLRRENVPIEDVRELAMLDNRFSAETMKAISQLEYTY